MGAAPAISLSPLETGHEGERSRSARLAGVGEAVRLYEDLERALAQITDQDLARIAGAARNGGRGLSQWARRVEAFRTFKRRFEAGVYPPEGPSAVVSRAGRRLGRWELVEPGSVPYLWETLAFLVGFGAALVVM